MGQAMGFFTDTSVCIGCKACQVACHQWNSLPGELATSEDTRQVAGQHPETEPGQAPGKQTKPLTGDSYDNTGSLSAVNWRHVKFIEKSGTGTLSGGKSDYEQTSRNRENLQWLMMSDICKHCVQAPCLEVCPTGAIMRTEFDSVYIQEPVCNGCRNCVSACPFGVIHMSGLENEGKGTAKKCTLCYDRLQHGLTPACSKACPTESIQFGQISDLRVRAQKRVEEQNAMGIKDA